ncbi:MAG: T9SS type A sorting domain-containing protein [Candidatus Cloacimonetes bacterium]|nr:T9SS type A sorting domain-containing protein [Candidatus Cloacimonadota bacterium]
MKKLFLLLLFLGVLRGLFAETYYVPEDYGTIQGAIEGVIDGDIVIVSPGVYEENINFIGKAITLGSLYYTTQDTSYIAETIIDGGDLNSVVVFENEEESTTVLTGFTITNGHADEGGGIRCYHSSPGIDNLIVHDNWALIGGGLHIEGSDVILSEMRISNNTAMYDGAGVFVISNISLTIMNSRIINNTTQDGWGGGIMIWETGTHLINVYIAGNHADGDGGGIYAKNLNDDMENVIVENNTATENGGGIYLRSSKSALLNCVIADNSAGSMGGGIYFQYSTHDLINVTLANNTADSGGGIYCFYNCNIILVNTIMWGDNGQEIYFAESESANTVVVAYADIDNGIEGIVTNNNGEVIWLEGNMDSDPLFDDQPGWEYHLSPLSPCIDSGTTYFEIEGEVLVDLDEDEYWGESVEMGAYEYELVETEEFKIENVKCKISNYPNPFYMDNSRSGFTQISFYLANDSHASLDIYNCRGRKIKNLIDKTMTAGEHQLKWDGCAANGSQAASGVYFYKLSTGEFSETRKLLLIR